MKARLWERATGLTLALLLQSGFTILLMYSLPVFRPPVTLAPEMTLFLPRQQAQPTPSLKRMPGTARALPLPPAPETTAPVAPAIAPAPLPGIENFGQALNGCAPEGYGRLPPDKRVLCRRPGGDVAIQELPGLLPGPSHAKDRATWQEQWDEAHWMPGLCGPSLGETVALCLMHQAIAEAERAADVNYHLARDKAASLQQAEPVLPGAIAQPRSMMLEKPVQ